MVDNQIILEPVEDSIFSQFSPSSQQALRLSGVVPVADPMIPLWTLPDGTRTVVLIGGRGGMKTWGVSQFIAYQAAVNKKRCVVLRDEKSRISETILNEILLRYDDIPFDTGMERLSTGLKEKGAEESLVFTMGFKASDNKKTANMKGVSNIDIAVIEEAEDIRDVKKFNDFTDGLRKAGCLVIIILNTPDLGHWILKRYFHCNIEAPIPEHIPDEERKNFEGFYEIKPKELTGFVCIKTGFENNIYLPAAKVQEYKDYGIPGTDRYDPHHFMTAIMGYSSSGRKGQVLRNVKEISLKDYLALPFKEIYGQDFGPAAPSPLVGVKFDKNRSYCRVIDYTPKTTLDIGILYCKKGFTNERIIADNADKEAWMKLRSGWKRSDIGDELANKYPQLLRGFNIWPCIKNGVKVGIDLLNTMDLYAVTESEELWTEIQMRIYAQDKNGQFTNEPEPGYDHAQDGWIYVATDYRKKKWSVMEG